MRGFQTLALTLAVLCSATAARADESARDQAKKHFKAAEVLKDAGRYDDAIAEYQKAYDLAPLPVLLFNLGQVYRLKGDAPKAIESYQKYLTVEPDGQPAEEARQHVSELTEQLRKDKEASDAKAAAEPGAKPVVSEPIPAAEPAATPEPPRHAGSGLRIAGIVTAVVGVAAIGGGVIYGMKAKSDADDVGKLTMWSAAAAHKDSDGRAAARNANILYAVGGAAVIGGGVMWYLGHRAGKRAESVARLDVAPVVGPTTAGLVLGGQF